MKTENMRRHSLGNLVPLYNYLEVAEYFNVKSDTVSKWVTNGKLAAVQPEGSKIRMIREDELQKFVDKYNKYVGA